MHDEDPRMDGFNYGRGWGNNPKPHAYLEGMKLVRKLGQVAVDKAQEAWTLEMALRNIRIATTGVEKAMAVTALTKLMRKYHNQIAAE